MFSSNLLLRTRRGPFVVNSNHADETANDRDAEDSKRITDMWKQTESII